MSISTKRQRRGSIHGLVPGVLLAAALLSACEAPPKEETKPPFQATELENPRFGADFRLKDANQQERTLKDWRGKVILLFFGYTFCPDACPTSLFRAAKVMEILSKDAQNVQVLFVTLDPKRDTPEVLREYPAAFHPDFIGLYAAPEDTPKLAQDFQVFYRINPGSTPETYSIDHSISTYVYDTTGRLRLMIDHEATPEAVANDIQRLLAHDPTRRN